MATARAVDVSVDAQKSRGTSRMHRAAISDSCSSAARPENTLEACRNGIINA